MSMKFKQFLSAVFCLLTTGLLAQCDAPFVTMNRPFEVAKDYLEGQDEVESALDWLCSQPLNQCISEREQLNSFVMIWLSGTPQLTLELDPSSVPFLRDHPDLLFPMIHGMTRMALKRNETSTYELYAGGFRTVDRLTRDWPKKEKSSELKELHKAVRKGKLQDYIQEHCTVCAAFK